ncbi:MAG TPA: YetF domain-containing protein [Actinomycetota bacterium]
MTGPIIAAGLGTEVRSIAIVAGSTASIYLFLIVLLRLFGRRQLGQLTVIDLVVVLLLGSAVETSLIHGDVSLPAGFASAGTLLLMNRLLTALFLRSERFCNLVGGGPVLLVHDGSPVEEHLRRVGMTHTDLEEVLRARGYQGTAGVREAILETDGSVSVIPRSPGSATTT